MTAQRMLFLLLSITIFIGIWLSGYDQVHVFSYVPAVALAISGLTGHCPGLALLKKLGFK